MDQSTDSFPFIDLHLADQDFLSRNKTQGKMTFLSICDGQIFYLCYHIYSLQSFEIQMTYSFINKGIRAQNYLVNSPNSHL